MSGTGLCGRRKNLMVVAAAIRLEDGFILTAPPPARHCNLVQMVCSRKNPVPDSTESSKGDRQS